MFLQVLLLDEITVDLDVLGRADLMRFLVQECEQRGATIVYATHIFDGLEFWPTHVAYVARGKLRKTGQYCSAAGAAAVNSSCSYMSLGLLSQLAEEVVIKCASVRTIKHSQHHPATLHQVLAHSQPPPGMMVCPCACCHCAAGKLQFCEPATKLPQLAQGQLLELVTHLLREERDAAIAAGLVKTLEYDPAREGQVGAFSYVFNNGWVPSTLATSLAHGTNAIMRQ